MLTPSRKGHLAVLAGAFCISFSGLFVKGAPIDPSMVAFYRLLFGASALFLVAVLRGDRLAPSRRMLGMLMLAGTLFGGDLLTWHASIVSLGPGLSTILSNFQVFFLALYGAFFLKETLSWRHKAAMPLALFGLWLILDLSLADLSPTVTAGVTLALISAVFYAGYILALRKSQMDAVRLAPVPNMAWASLLSALAVGLFCLGSDLSFAIPDVRTGALLAVLGIVCQAFGWLLSSIGLPHLPPSRAGLIMLTQPALTFVWDILFCGRVTSLTGYLGAAIAIGAIGLGLLAPAPKKRNEPLMQESAHAEPRHRSSVAQGTEP